MYEGCGDGRIDRAPGARQAGRDLRVVHAGAVRLAGAPGDGRIDLDPASSAEANATVGAQNGTGAARTV